ncbi:MULTISPECIES: WXG100 family type VII secretion target [Streptomyces]|uniref:WXG100 family type VII secretion target n=1 Tax=Streptomyces TaxID=1883 RepID=UPI002E123723|nr:WXG100 family type VII secretion target [Streptomyces sp. NBC_01244]
MPEASYDHGSINIHYATTDGVTAQLINASEAIDTVLNNLQTAIAQWADSCVGMDKGAFNEKIVEWHGYVDHAAQAVAGSGKLLRDIAEGYGVLDRGLANDWGNLQVY